MLVKVPGFDLRLYCNTAKNRQIATTLASGILNFQVVKPVESPYMTASIASLIVIKLTLM